eukprot:Nitzschia sp. Nitz4//scaffold148_size54725//25559//26776//NITZ4_006657-RA/size54725-processed-gene-0.21-mRNA-1//-1//CDS//3329536745//3304//frame0
MGSGGGGKYVPPHLRNKASSTATSSTGASTGGSQTNNNNNSSSSSSNARSGTGTTASRWSQFDRPSNTHTRNSNNYGDRHGDRQDDRFHHTTTNNNSNSHSAPSGNRSSRWNQLESNSNSNNNSNSNYSRRWQQHQAASKPSPKIMFFGDSFVRLFGLVENDALKVEAFKGATSKGLGNLSVPHTEKQARIVQLVKQHRPERCVFCFGSVDTHLSWYYKKYVKGEDLDLYQVATNYATFLASLQEYTTHIHVVSVYPSPVKPEVVEQSVANYGAVEQGTPIAPEDCTVEARMERVRAYNRGLEDTCRKFNLHYESAVDDVLDPTTQLVKRSYTDVSSHNIHLVWETTVLLWLDKWEWYRDLAPPDLMGSLQKTLEEYLQTKPWAEEEHVAARVGIQEAHERDQEG